MRYLLILLALLTPSAAFADGEVTLSSEVFVERASVDANGGSTVSLEKPDMVTPGDKLVFILSYRNEGGEAAGDFVITNPIPKAVAFSAAESDGAVFSVDGGKAWGLLESLEIIAADGTARPATAADVTHIRWRFSQPIPAGEAGKLSFRGVVK